MKRKPKLEYFRERFKQAIIAKDYRRATYYQKRIHEIEGPDAVVVRTRQRVADMPSEQRVKIAARILSETESPFSQNAKHVYLLSAGLTESEYLSALALAGAN